jgi:hypothetical protein
MSMNLHVRVKNKEFPIWQTPTRITYTITAGEWDLRGAAARRALRAYYEWVKYSTNGSWSSIEELEDAKKHQEEHLAELEPLLNSKDLHVYVL